MCRLQPPAVTTNSHGGATTGAGRPTLLTGCRVSASPPPGTAATSSSSSSSSHKCAKPLRRLLPRWRCLAALRDFAARRTRLERWLLAALALAAVLLAALLAALLVAAFRGLPSQNGAYIQDQSE